MQSRVSLWASSTIFTWHHFNGTQHTLTFESIIIIMITYTHLNSLSIFLHSLVHSLVHLASLAQCHFNTFCVSHSLEHKQKQTNEKKTKKKTSGKKSRWWLYLHIPIYICDVDLYLIFALVIVFFILLFRLHKQLTMGGIESNSRSHCNIGNNIEHLGNLFINFQKNRIETRKFIIEFTFFLNNKKNSSAFERMCEFEVCRSIWCCV